MFLAKSMVDLVDRHRLSLERRIYTVFPMRTAIYPGSFDPLTNGHLDVIQRATKLFDRVIVAVAKNESKNPLFTLEERVELVRASRSSICRTWRRIPSTACWWITSSSRKAQAVVRGLRAVSDFEFEFQLALDES